MRPRTWFLLLLLPILGLGHAQRFTFEIHSGTSHHAPNMLVVRQSGHPDVAVRDATHTTRPFVPFTNLAGLTANYYALRIGYFPYTPRPAGWDPGIEIELLHDKAYYESGDDPDGVIRHFEVSDGLNQVFVNLALRTPLWTTAAYPEGRLHLLVRAGAGPVVTVPASDVRGRVAGTRSHLGDEGFFWLAGPGAQLALQGRYFVAPWLAVSGEAKATAAVTRNPIADGFIDANYHGAQFNLGLTFGVR